MAGHPEGAPARGQEILVAETRSVMSTVLRLGLPAMAGMLSQWFLGIADEYQVGRLAIGATPQRGAEAIANVLVGNAYLLALVITFNALSVGTQAVASRRWGEGDRAAAGKVLTAAVTIALLIAALLTPLYLLTSRAIIWKFTGSDASVNLETVHSYLQIRLWSVPAILLMAVLNGWFAAAGNTVVVMLTALLLNFTNILFNWLWIEGHWGFARLEEAGAALASCISTYIGLAVLVCYALFARWTRPLHLLRQWRPQFGIMRGIARLSLPSFVHLGSVHLGFAVFLGVIIPRTIDGTAGVAAAGITWITSSIGFFVSFGFGVAAATLMGQSLGARDPQRARRSVLAACLASELVMIPIAATLFFCGEWLASLFNSDPEVIRLAGWLFMIVASFQLIDNIGIVLGEGFKGAGMTFFIMAVEVPLHIAVFLTLAWYFGVALGWGVIGAWAAIIPYVVLYAAIVGIAFQRGLWMRGKA